MLVSKQYAEAISDITTVDWDSTLQAIHAIVEQPVFKQLSRNPFISSEHKASLVIACIKKATKEEKGLIQALAKHGRFDQVKAIHEQYLRNQLIKQGTLKVEITTANKPSPKQKKLIENFAILQTGSDTNTLFEYHINDAIIGGFILKFNDYIIDKSLAARLESIGHNTQGS
tara:strand:+ start:2016 stop:2531 length:516 start_codon:yes stop_codon:yes gene_type:complete